MASTTFLLTTLLLAASAIPVAFSQQSAPAPASSSAATNLTAILEKGGQYATLIRLLEETQLDTQINSQLKNSFNGLTVFAPTDNAFNSLKPGTLNALSQQEQVALVLYHVLPTFYSMEMFQTASNPVRTQASGNDGVYTVNITSTTSQVNVSTGVDETSITNTLASDFPLAVYSLEKVLLPFDIFGAKPPAAAPPPAAAGTPAKAAAPPPAGDATAAAGSSSSSGAESTRGRGVAPWSGIVGVGVVVMGIVGNLL